jgi:hypothetical protein
MQLQHDSCEKRFRKAPQKDHQSSHFNFPKQLSNKNFEEIFIKPW